MKDNNALGWVGSAVTILTGSLSQDVMQIILLVIGICSALFSLFVNIYTWWKKAKEDGKISKEELDELNNIINKGDKK